MAAHYLSYWKPSTVKAFFRGEDHLLGHAASEQYGNIKRGDTVWIVTTWPGGWLILLGPIVIDLLTDQTTAARRLRNDDLWQSKYHILAPRGRAEPAREVDLLDLAPHLRFDSDQDRLKIIRGKVDAKQLQSMRRLTPESAELLRQRWGEDAAYAEALSAIRQGPPAVGGGFGALEANRKVERAAVDFVTTCMRAAGWNVESVEADRVGFDLLCIRRRERRHLEVKGVRGAIPSFIITEGERRRAEEDPHFWLCVVTEALGGTPVIHELTGERALAQYRLIPLAHRAIPVGGAPATRGRANPPIQPTGSARG